MIKYLFYSLFAMLVFSSCSKEHETASPVTPDGKLYPIKFNLSGFTQTTKGGLSTKQSNGLKGVFADTSGTGKLDILYYLVYDAAGKFVHQLTQNSDSASFAGFSDNLAAGNYNLYFIAGKTGLKVDTVNAQAYYIAPGDSLGNWHDTFMAKVALTVNGAGSQNVVLNRTVAALRVNITDAIPANAAKIVTTIQYDFVYYKYLNRFNQLFNTPYVKTLTTKITPALIGTTDLQQYTILAGNNGVLTSVFINCYDASNNIIGSAVIGSAGIQPNHETILTGKLFGATDSQNSFKISVNNAWNPVPHVTIPF
jgi:hypothetical protein